MVDLNPLHWISKANHAFGDTMAQGLEFLGITDPAVDPDGVREIAKKWRHLAKGLEDAGHDVDLALADVVWEGQAAKAFHKRAKSVRKGSGNTADALHKGADALDKFADEAHELISEIGVMVAEIAEFEIAGLALSVLTAGLSDVAATLATGERALKIMALIARLEERGSALASVVRGVLEAIRYLERTLRALKDVKAVAEVTKAGKVGKMALQGAAFSAFSTALEDPGAFKDPEKLAGLLGLGALMGVGGGLLGKSLGKGLKALKPSELSKLAKTLGIGGSDLSKLKLRPGEAEKIEAGIQEAEKECKLDPIDVATGSMLLPQVDVELAASLPLILQRTHLSSYRWGGWFGPSWGSTLDQRLQADDERITFAAPDGSRLVYPHPASDATEPVFPETGPRLPLAWDTEVDGALRITNPATGLSYVFHSPRPTAHDEAVDLPLQFIVSRNGQRIAVHYDEHGGAPIEVAHSAGYRIALDRHDSLPRISGLRLLDSERPHGRGTLLVSYGYDQHGNLTEVRNSTGIPLQFTYDSAGRITSWTDRNANTYTYTYDDRGRVVRTEGSGGYLSGTLSYDDTAHTTTVTNTLGHTTTFEHNEAYRLIRETDALGHTRSQEWDTDGRLAAMTDALGHTTRVHYDTSGLVTSVAGPDGQESTSTYDEAGLPVAITGPDDSTWRQEFDEHGNRTAVTDPTGITTRYTYTASGQLRSITDALGHTTQFRYNPAGLPMEIIDQLGAVTRCEYDAMGRQTAVTDPLGNTTRHEWTVEGHPARRTYPDGTSESWTYDAESNCTTHTDPMGGLTRFEYGDFDLLTARTTPDGARYTFAHDAELRLTQVTNPQGLRWSYTYDPAGRLTSETDFDRRTLTYTYDAASRFASRTTPLGQFISHHLDPAGRILAKEVDGERTTYAYNAAGHLTQAATPTSLLELSYDAAGRVLSETVDGHTIRFGYDAMGRRTHRSTPGSTVTEVTLDAAGLPTAMLLAGHRLDFTRDGLGRETARTFGLPTAPLTLDITWDPLGRRTSQQLTAPGRTLRFRSYAYRADNNLIGTTDHVLGEQQRVDLDPAGRPLQVTADSWSESYTYDAAGNQSGAHWPDAAPHPEARGERTYSGTRIRTAGAIRYEHDAAGRTVLRQKTRLSRKPDTWRYEYDAEDHLVVCTTPDGTTWRYSYDPLGRRKAKHRMAPDGETIQQTIRFTWDGTNLAEQTDTAADTVTTWEYDDERPLAQFESRSAGDALNQAEVDTRFFAVVTDLVGAPTELVDEQGGIAWHARTTMWGTTAWNRDASAYTPLRFPGQYADSETGLHYNFLRHYDPDTARYTTPDPFGLVPAPNPVTYTANPQTWSDPLGLVPKSCLQDKYKWDGSVRFGKLDDLGRPTGAWATLRKEMLDTGTEAGSTWTPGWRGNGTDFNEARGHLLANRLGGPGKGRLARHNLVTLTQNPVNTPVMRDLEGKVYDAVKGGQNVQYSVKPIYAGTNPIPIKLEISAFGDRGFKLTNVLENPASGVRTG